MFQHPPPESSLTRQQGLKIHKEFRQVKAFLVDDPEITKILLLDAWKTALVLPGFMALMHGKQIWTFESTVYLPFGRLALLSMVLLQIVNSHRDFFASKKSGRNEWTRFAHLFVVAVVCLYILFSGSDRYVCICNMSFFNEVVTPAFSVVEIMKKKKLVMTEHNLVALRVAYWGISLVRLPVWLFLVSVISKDLFIYSLKEEEVLEEPAPSGTDQIQISEFLGLAALVAIMVLDQIWKAKILRSMIKIQRNIRSKPLS